MGFEALEFLRAAGGDPDPAGSRLDRAAAMEAIEDAAEARQAERRRAEAEERQEVRALMNRQWGDPLGQMRMAQADMVNLSDRVSDLRDQLAKAEDRLDRARSNLTFWAERGLLAEEATRRSYPNPVEAAVMRAADVAREIHENRDILERARRAVRHGH